MWSRSDRVCWPRVGDVLKAESIGDDHRVLIAEYSGLARPRDIVSTIFVLINGISIGSTLRRLPYRLLPDAGAMWTKFWKAGTSVPRITLEKNDIGRQGVVYPLHSSVNQNHAWNVAYRIGLRFRRVGLLQCKGVRFGHGVVEWRDVRGFSAQRAHI